MSAETVAALLDEARQFAQKAREFQSVAGAMFGGHPSTAQHKALADAVDRLAAVCETLADAAARESQLEVLLAWESGELSEGQACRLLGAAAGGTTGPVIAREMKEAAIAAARNRWAKWRDSNPPSPGSGP